MRFDDRAAEEYGIIRADLERSGTPIAPNDLLISALARSRDLTLVSFNRQKFSQVAGLRLMDTTVQHSPLLSLALRFVTTYTIKARV